MGCYKKWDKETCFNEALKYRTKSEFAKSCVGAYAAARRHNWLYDYTWFEWGGKWNKEACFDAAKKYKNRWDFSKYCSGAYASALKNKWIDDYTWFETNKWNKETCFNEAKKYHSRNEFRKGSKQAYRIALKNKWLDDYNWFDGYKKWNYKSCLIEAKKYKTKQEFYNQNKSAYGCAYRNKWLNEYIWLKDKRLNIFTDAIDSVYVYEFKEQNAAYIGRTLINSQKRRDWQHIFILDTVSSFAKEHNVAVPQMKILETNLTISEGVRQEEYWLQKYKSDGWITLNKAKTGGIGSIGKGKWNKKKCFQEAKKYINRTDFEKGNQSAYQVARKNKWLDDYTWFIPRKKPNGYWNNYDNCFAEAQKYSSRSEFSTKSSSAYNSAVRNNWLDDMFKEIK